MIAVPKQLMIIMGAAILLSIFAYKFSATSMQTADFCFTNNCFDVEIAKTPAQRERGLMFRNHLDKDQGMLFVFNKEGNYPFWMKDTLINLDIIWFNRNWEIVFIKENALPCLPAEALVKEGEQTCPIIDPSQNAKYVLEINRGLARVINLKIGDKAYFK